MLYRRTLLHSGIALATSTLCSHSWSQSFPSRPVTLILPLAPGGMSDMMARTIAQHASQQLGKPVIVENRPGGGGQIAAKAVLQQPADGHTVFVGGTAMFAINQSLFQKFSYDPVKDFEPVTTLITAPLILVVPASSSVKSVKELVALAKTQKDGVTFASQGLGTIGHLLGDLFRTQAGGKMSHVAYKGSMAALQDVITGRVDFMFDPIISTEALIKAGKLQALAIADTKRSALLPNVPTLAELGLPGLEYESWFGAAVKTGTPTSIVAQLNKAFVSALHDTAIQKKFLSQGLLVKPQTPEQFRHFIHSEVSRWASLVKASGASIE